MAFTAISKGAGIHNGRPKSTTVRAAAIGSSNSVRVLIPSNVLAAMGHPRYCRVHVGTGADEGFIALEPAASKTDAFTVTKAGRSKHNVQVTFNPKWIGIPQRSNIAVTHVKHEIADGSLIVDIRPVIEAAKAKERAAANNTAATSPVRRFELRTA